MNIAIRLATVNDIDSLHHLINASVSRLSTQYYSNAQIRSALTHVFGVDTQLIKDNTYYVAESGLEMVGAGGWSKRKTLYGGDQRKRDQPDSLLNPATDAARIRAFYIHPDWSRVGIGSMILQACEDAASTDGFKRLELAATLPGLPFYLARRYQKGEPISIEMPDGESLPTFLMTKLL